MWCNRKERKIVGLSGIINAYEAGCRSSYEIAEYLGVTEEYLQECIGAYREKYGTGVNPAEVIGSGSNSAEYAASRPAYLIIEVDGYQELVADLRDSERSHVMEALNRTLEQYFARTNGFLRRVSVSRYIAVVEERHMKEIVAARFDLLDKVRALNDQMLFEKTGEHFPSVE